MADDLPPREAPDTTPELHFDTCLWKVPPVSVLVVASDGVWDALTCQQAVTIAAATLLSSGSPEAAARQVVGTARARGSTDDITALVLWFVGSS